MKKLFRTGLAALLALVIIICGAAAVLPASAAQDEIPEWAADDNPDEGLAPTGYKQFPETYDLRNEGVVTPVKDQAYWGTCWSFGPIAAAETSILSSLGYTYEETGLDLSERHLAYFAYDHLTKEMYPSQAGEGLYYYEESEDPNIRFENGGDFLYVTSLFAQGIGPLPELWFPYRGVDDNGESNYLEEYHAYSPFDDWSIPEYSEDGYYNRFLTYGFVLKDGNDIDYWDKDGDCSFAIEAFKQELVNGRAVAATSNFDDRYLATSKEMGQKYAAYCSDGSHSNHIFCIVGWDDNYDAANFTHTKDGNGDPMTDAQGNVLSDEEAAEMTTPPGNGAWIVKNSWGSDTDVMIDDLGNLTGKGNSGVLDEDGNYTGYLYLSYYDTSLRMGETYEFATDLSRYESFTTYQYDYMPAAWDEYYNYSLTPMSSANVFTAYEASQLKSVSTSTLFNDARVTFAIYLLDDDAEDPTDGKLAYRFSKNFELSGFHRVLLDRPLDLEEGQRFSVVSTVSGLDEDGSRIYGITANEGISDLFARLVGEDWYAVAVVNKGESFLYNEGEWIDWSDYLNDLFVPEEDTLYSISEKFIDFCPIDNFSIKAYLVSAGEEITGLLGDVNLNGEVEITDATKIQRALCEMDELTKTPLALADVDGDGEITILDATAIQRWIADMPTQAQGIGEPFSGAEAQ